ncbi:caspase family protein [Clostridioides difficile]|nr:caspase family protein [Clostridioides difficile]MDO0345281.1 caspase family protein [Clostridioides difficile]
MNLAILIGVSELYNMKDKDLPSCKNDIYLISSLLSKIKKFDDILVLDNNDTAIFTKNKIMEFINKNENSEIDELFFYFTGHGYCDNEEFYYILSDYEEGKMKQTTLQNSELDQWIRNLNPNLTVKIVDACYSGIHYVKDFNIEKTIKKINNCYFMYSSQNNQASWASKRLSHFTESFIKSIISIDSDKIRYKEIVDFISDDFENNNKQTPFFVLQAKMSEIFADIDSSVKCDIDTLLKNILENSDENDSKNENVNLIDAIISDSLRYCKEVDLVNNLSEIQECIKNYSFHIEDLKNLYSLEINFSKYHPDELTNLNEVGSWIENNDDNYFAKPIYEEEEYTKIVKKPKYKTLFSSYFEREYIEEEVTCYRDIVTGFELTQETEFSTIKIVFNPEYENLKSYFIYIFFIFSKKEIVFFTYYDSYKELNWTDKELNLKNKWVSKILPLKEIEKIKTYLMYNLGKIETSVHKELLDKFNS